MNSLKGLREYGQSVWMDYIDRKLILTGKLKQLVDDDGLAGVTSNPTIFQKAITGTDDYSNELQALKRDGVNGPAIYERLVIHDIQDTADVLWPLYKETSRMDGYVSIEVSPYLAHDTAATVREGQRLWNTIARENLMIKVPGTKEGIPAIEQLISQGINVNVTLLFSRQRYEQAARAYMRGVGKFGDAGGVCSVASFFVSRIDTAVDAIVESRLTTSRSAAERLLLRGLLGKVAISNAKLAYQQYKELFRSKTHTQRLLWASTSVKNPRYRDVMYVEELIGSNTVNTMSPATIDAFRDHGQVRPSLEENIDVAQDTMDALEEVGISMNDVTEKLLADGVQLFATACDQLLAALDRKAA